MFDRTRVQVLNLREKVSAIDTTIKHIVQDEWAMLEPSLSSFVDNFRVWLNKSVRTHFFLVPLTPNYTQILLLMALRPVFGRRCA